MSSFYEKNRRLFLCVVFVVLFVSGAFAASRESDKNDIENANAQTKYANIMNELDILEKNVNEHEKQVDSGKVTTKKGKKTVTKKITPSEKTKLEKQIATDKKQIQKLQEELSNQKKLVEELQRKTEENHEGEKVDVRGWHPKAQGQIIVWDFNRDKNIVELTILDKTTQETFKAFAKFKTNKGDRYFLSDSLPAGLQVVMPGSGIRNWVVNIDARKGYVEKIVNHDNIVNSPTDASSNKDDYGGKTFESGEAFLILKQTPMTIRPPIY